MASTIWALVVGLLLTLGGAELLVRGASRLAAAVGISPLVIGLTVVAFGTSAPEMAVSVRSALGGSEIAIGNVLGSNIFNVLFILGISALITPLAVAQQLIRIDVPVMVGVTLAAWGLALGGGVSRLEGTLLFAGIVLYTLFAIRLGRRERAEVQAKYAEQFGSRVGSIRGVALHAGLVLTGLAMLVLGADRLVEGAVELARWFGVGELVIGLTIVAAGTSVPEVATSVVAALRRERDIAVGNVVGSNLFNLLSVLGVSAIVAPSGVTVSTAVMQFDFPVTVAVAALCLPVFLTGHTNSRWEGVLFLLYYILYSSFVVLAAIRPELSTPYGRIVLFGILPLTVLPVGYSLVRHFLPRAHGS